MLFNSYEFMFLFLPITLIVYFLLNRWISSVAGRLWLAAASLFFYSWWNPIYLPLILSSIVVNYLFGSALVQHRSHWRISQKGILTLGVCFNVGLLGYFKYTDFFISNINTAFSTGFPLPHIILPLGISFFTFTQIAYLVDAYRGHAKEYSVLNYVLFVSFFPHLLAGPILHHSQMMPQFQSSENKRVNEENLARGLFLFVIGLFKKVIIADTLAVWANYGFDTASSLTLVEAWVTSLSYTFQLYFDFSGYTDMAIGAALMFNIRLPINFDSPYKSLGIQEFWRRWHITLGHFLRDYIYIPLGGNRGGEFGTYRNLMLTFLIGGLWHGAGWTFVFWGFLHGFAQVIQRAWRKLGLHMNRILAWFITFNFVNIAWVFFRAKSWGDALKVLEGMVGMNGLVLPIALSGPLQNLQTWGVQFNNLQVGGDVKQALMVIAISFILCLGFRNSIEMEKTFRPNMLTALIIVLMAVISILQMTHVSEFLYFNF